MKFLVVVNESPWGSSLTLAAWRFVKAALDSKIQVPAVYFQADGVYAAQRGELADAGTPDLSLAWSDLAASSGLRLLMCSSSWLRRLDLKPASAFQPTGLTELIELMLSSDRVVTF